MSAINALPIRDAIATALFDAIDSNLVRAAVKKTLSEAYTIGLDEAEAKAEDLIEQAYFDGYDQAVKDYGIAEVDECDFEECDCVGCVGDVPVPEYDDFCGPECPYCS